MKTAISYMRVSTDIQETSIDIQRNAINEYTKENDIHVIKEFEDYAISGGKLWERPEVHQLLMFIKENQVDYILINSLDRLSRDSLHIGWIINEVERISGGKTKIESLKGEDIYNPEQRIVLNMHMIYAEMERGMIRARFKAGKLNKRKNAQNSFIGGQIPLGYKHNKTEKSLEIQENEAIVVRRIFELREECKTLRELVSCLNEEGYKTKNGKEFKPMSVKRILDREELYKGQGAPSIL